MSPCSACAQAIPANGVWSSWCGPNLPSSFGTFSSSSADRTERGLFGLETTMTLGFEKGFLNANDFLSQFHAA